MSQTPSGLQNEINILHTYCNKWKLEINLSKTKVMIFSKRSLKTSNKWNYGNKNINCVTSYTYLGILMTSSGNFTKAKQILSEKASKALFALNRALLFNTDINIFIKLFNSNIKPILLYGAEIWGSEIIDFTKWDRGAIEKIHLKYCKRILGLNKYASNAACRSEIGSYPLLTEVHISMFKYWLRIRELPENNITKWAYNEQKNPHNSYTWMSTIKSILTDINQNSLYDTEETIINSKFKNLINNVKCQMKQTYTDHWRSNIMKDGSKLRTYSKFKQDYCYEQYLSAVININQRISLTKFRTSNHDLSIEVGRYTRPKTPLLDRICLHCDMHKVEDEEHLLIVCPKYKTLRQDLFSHIILPNEIESNNDKFQFLMKITDKFSIKHVAQFVFMAFQQRTTNT